MRGIVTIKYKIFNPNSQEWIPVGRKIYWFLIRRGYKGRIVKKVETETKSKEKDKDEHK